MIVRPYSPDRARRSLPVVLVDAEGMAWDEHGSGASVLHPSFAHPPGPSSQTHAAYIGRDDARELITAGRGAGIYWRDRLIEWRPTPGVGVRVLPADNAPPSFSDRLLGLVLWAGWLHHHGVEVAGRGPDAAPASIGSASMRLLRATLAAPLWCSAPVSELPPIHGVIGGRQESVAPGSYDGPVALWDMRAAYASTLATTPYGGRWRHLGRATARRMDWPGITAAGTPAFLRCRVRMTSGDGPGPLPRRPRAHRSHVDSDLRPVEYPRTGVIQGTWTATEVLAAARAGAEIRILDGWLHMVDSAARPFGPWWDVIAEGRDDPGYAGTLAKMTGNALVGAFHIDRGNLKRRVWFEHRARHSERVKMTGTVRPAWDLAEHVTGTVRARLYADALLPLGDRVLACHTDSVWITADKRRSSDDRTDRNRADGDHVERPSRTAEIGRPARRGDHVETDLFPRERSLVGVRGSPGWRHDDTAEVIDLIDSQHLAYRRPGDPRTHYKMAGVPDADCEHAMDQLWTASFGQGSPQRRTRPMDHVAETESATRRRKVDA